MLTREQALTLHAKRRIPDGHTCSECVNYRPFCRSVLASSAGYLDPSTRECYWEPSRFNVPVAEGSLKDYRRAR